MIHRCSQWPRQSLELVCRTRESIWSDGIMNGMQTTETSAQPAAPLT